MKSVVHLWKMEEAANAVEVDTFDYPYCANGKKGAPPKAEKLVESHREEISRAVSQHPCHPLVLVGKSMGSRVSCMVAGTEGTDVAAVVCPGYPLRAIICNTSLKSMAITLCCIRRQLRLCMIIIINFHLLGCC
ncbi:uncharacterized protein [Physcomitrium patens]|uniref:uncharacterized protein isoform X1 n=1 Tax=Physcomitrium patens TaxID=3218 RepID=UPI000D16F5FF|nr:uncharacterized protein LOC112275281 [Physcomitrium patens]|eukprot:XP_024361288.1 uncharacterized protein LOC112275281 [Physcomitrella patens]